MMKRNVAMIGLCVLCMATALTGCGAKRDTPQVEEVQQTESVQQTDEYAEVTLPEVLPYVVVDTEYGELKYQDQWAEFMRTEQKTEDGSVTVSFEAEINGTRYPLFDVVIGGSDGNSVGELTDSSGITRNVYVSMKELTPSSDLSEGEQNRLYAMQEDINYVIENLK